MRKAVCFLCMLAVTGSISFAQSGITVNFRQTPLKEVLDYVSSQSRYKFVYSDALKIDDYKVTVHSSNEPFKKLLDKIFDGTGISYTLKGDHVILVADRAFGVISDEETKETIPGVTVKNVTRNIVTAADDLGRYSIVAGEGDLLVFSSIGMEERSVVVGKNPRVSVLLKAKSIALEDVVVTGYQTLSKERVTGSFAVVTSKKLEKKLQPHIASALEGQSAGVVLTKDGEIEIRGVSTIWGISDPLVVVDGYPLIGVEDGLRSINPDVVESITVLKDAVAASIYGARASNGVIVITTKQARKGTLGIQYKGTYSVTLKPKLSKLNLASVEDYMDAEADLYRQDPNRAWAAYTDHERVPEYTYLLMSKDRGLISSTEADKRIEELRHNNSLNEVEKYLLRPERSQQHSLALTSGTATNQHISSLRYSRGYGRLRHNYSSKFIADVNNIWKPTDWLSVRFNSNINYFKETSTEEGYSTFTFWGPQSKILPYTKLYDENGRPVPFKPVGQKRLEKYETYPGMKPVDYHPATDLPKCVDRSGTLRIRLGGDIDINFFDFLSGSIGGSWINDSYKNRSVSTGDSFDMRTAYNDGTSATNHTKHYIPEGGRIDENRGTSNSWVIRAQLNYHQSFDNEIHRVRAMFGSEISKDTYETVFMPTRLGYDPVSATYNSGFYASDYNNNTNNMSGDMLFGMYPENLGGVGYGNNYKVRDNRFVSWYGNSSYEYMSRYILTGSARLDLTNFFGTDPKYRYRPTWSVGGTWKIHEEPFFENLKNIFNRLSIRASYGINGNISLKYTPYLILRVGSYNTTTDGVEYNVHSYPNNQLRWERTGILNVGMDIAMFDGRLNIGFDYYKKKSTDLIVYESVDNTKGTGSLPQNMGGVTNKGFEITVSGDIINRQGLLWNSNLIVSYNTSMVDYYTYQRTFFSSYAVAPAILVQGYPMDGFWGARFAGLNDKGTALFYNSKGEKVEGGRLGPEDAHYLGTYRPKWDLSWTNTFSVGNFDLSFMFIGKFGHKYRKDSFSGSNYNNRHVGQRWRKPGDEANTIYPVLKRWNMDMFYYPTSDIFIANASYIKLRDLTFSYNLPKSVTDIIKLTSAKFFFQTRNLFYITAKGVDIDPETAELNYGGTGAMTNQARTSLQLRPEFYFGIMINL